jgi:cysteine-rich repeat protein
MRHRSSMLVATVGLAAVLQLAGCGDNDNKTSFDNCGNGTIDAGEQCDDGNTSDGDDCLSTCRDASCGDGFLNLGGEECDGNNLGGETCGSLGEGSGTLACATTCTFDTAGCGTGPNPTPTQTPDGPTPTPTPAGPTATDGGPTPTPTSTPPPGAACVAGDTVEATVNVAQGFGGITVSIAYPASLNIPGKNADASVGQRVIAQPSGGLKSPADQDNDADGTDDTFAYSFADTTPLPAGEFITVEFDCVPGETAPTSLPCVVDSASDELGTPISGVTCSITLVGP